MSLVYTQASSSLYLGDIKKGRPVYNKAEATISFGLQRGKET